MCLGVCVGMGVQMCVGVGLCEFVYGKMNVSKRLCVKLLSKIMGVVIQVYVRLVFVFFRCAYVEPSGYYVHKPVLVFYSCPI